MKDLILRYIKKFPSDIFSILKQFTFSDFFLDGITFIENYIKLQLKELIKANNIKKFKYFGYKLFHPYEMEGEHALYYFLMKERINRKIISTLIENEPLEVDKISSMINESNFDVFNHINKMRQGKYNLLHLDGNINLPQTKVSIVPERKKLITEIVSDVETKLGEMRGIKDVALRDAQIPQYEIDALQEIETLTNLKFNQVLRMKRDTKMGFITENNKVMGIGLSECELSALPESIGNLTSLLILSLDENRLESLPESIGNLTSLLILSLNGNGLESLPESIGNLTSLLILSLNENFLETLPEPVGNLTSLLILSLNGNKLKILPESIGNLKMLQKLDLRNNRLERLPESLPNIKSLRTIDLRENNITDLPMSLKENLIDRCISNPYSSEAFLEYHIKLDPISKENTIFKLSCDINTLKSFIHDFNFKNIESLVSISYKLIEKLSIDEYFNYLDSLDKKMLEKLVTQDNENILKSRLPQKLNEMILKRFIDRKLGKNNRELLIQILLAKVDDKLGNVPKDIIYFLEKIGIYYIDYLLEHIFTKEDVIDTSALKLLNVIKDQTKEPEFKDKIVDIFRSKINLWFKPDIFITKLCFLLDFMDFSEFLKLLNYNNEKMEFILEQIALYVDKIVGIDSEKKIESEHSKDGKYSPLFKIVNSLDDFFIDYMVKNIMEKNKKKQSEVISGTFRIFNFVKKGIKIDKDYYVSLIKRGELNADCNNKYATNIEKYIPIIYIYKNNVYSSKIKLKDYYDYEDMRDDFIEEGVDKLTDFISLLNNWLKNNRDLNPFNEKFFRNVKKHALDYFESIFS